LIHRDIKPANIFAASRGGVFDVAKLLDFGLVRQTESEVVEEGSQPRGGFSGSPAYMAPEQAADYANAGEASDIYALGAVAYYLLTGQPPFTGSAHEVLVAHARRAPPPLTEHVSSVPADLEQVVLRCLAKSPEERYPDAKSFEKALADCDCADTWTDEDAAKWWQEADQQPRNELTSPATPGTKVAIDRTIDSNTGA
jgi:serine/threonine-protein kinase